MTASIFERIVKLIPNDRYISRVELAVLTGMSDRYIRRQIERARRAGHRIISNTRSGGYKIASNGAEWMEFVERERRRAIATFKRTTGIPEAQMQLEGVSA